MAQHFASWSRSWHCYHRRHWRAMAFQFTYLQNHILLLNFVNQKKKRKKEKETITCKILSKNITCRPVEVLKIDTVLPVQTRRRLASLENAGGEDTKLFPPVIILCLLFYLYKGITNYGRRLCKDGDLLQCINPMIPVNPCNRLQNLFKIPIYN